MKASFLAAILVLSFVASSFAQDSTFTYQGRLSQGTNVADGDYEMQFTLFDAGKNGSSVGTPLTLAPVHVSNGLFNVALDFGSSAFDGSGRWMEISLSVFGSDMVPVTLAPRQAITATPHALIAARLSGSLENNNLFGTYDGPLRFSNPTNEYNGSFNGNGSALFNVNADTLCGQDCNLFWHLHGNAGSIPGLNFLGTTDNQPLELKVFGQRALRLEPTTNSPNIIGGYEGNFVTSNLYGVTISGGGASEAVHAVQISPLGDASRKLFPHFGTISGGSGNRIQAGGYGTIGGGSRNNIVNDQFVFPSHELSKDTIGGGADNRISESVGSTISGGESNKIHSGALDPVFHSTIGGGINNVINASGNLVIGDTIAGGANNSIRRSYGATIGGGDGNAIQVDAHYSSVAGGANNRIDLASSATISGGSGNRIDFRASGGTIGGGSSNVVLMPRGTIPGGRENAAGSYAFAAGRRAKATNEGSFVWADSQDADFGSTTTNDVSFRCAGGVRFSSGTGAANQTVSWAPGAASWSFSSDRNLKESVKTIDKQELLDKVSRLPVSEWNYKGHPQRHIGPMAQDFHALFPLNDKDTMLDSGDLHGITIAAVQALNQKAEDQAQQLHAKDAELESLKQRITRLENALSSLVAERR